MPVRMTPLAVLLVTLTSAAQAQEKTEAPLPPPITQQVVPAPSTPTILSPGAAETTIRLEIHGTLRGETVLDAVRKELAAEYGHSHRHTTSSSAGTPALGQIEILSLIKAAIDTINASRQRYALAEARRRVASELAEFCLAHDCAPIEPVQPEGVFLPTAHAPAAVTTPRATVAPR